MICKQFGLLPSNPALRELTDLHKTWIMMNMSEDSDQLRDDSVSTDKQDGENIGLDDDEFKTRSNKLREDLKNRA